MAIGKPLSANTQLSDSPEWPLEVSVIGEGDEGPDNKHEEEPDSDEFSQNLAEKIDENILTSICIEKSREYDADKRSRKDWEDSYEKGLALLGLQIEDRTLPWPGACGVYHPVMMETLIRFQAQAIMEIFPASGPARTQIIGVLNIQKEKQAERVQDELNYILVEKMTEYRDETEQLILRMGLAGSAFRKIYYDPSLGRPVAMYVPAEDFIVSYGTTDLRTCERATHVMRKTPFEVKRLQALGFYRDIDLPSPQHQVADRLQDKKNKLSGETPSIEVDERHQILEMCVTMDVPGYEEDIPAPYVMTFDYQSNKVLSLYRNWKESDPYLNRRQYYVKWQYLPGYGFYGTGLSHLLGGITQSVTSILRQLVDAGTINNLQGGLKSRGLRIKGDDTPIMPGEWRDVDILSGTIKDSIFPIPTKEPSAVLFELMQNLVDDARRIGAVADMKISDMSQQAPVGTTLAILEREMKVMSAVQARMHHSLKEEFRLIQAIIRDDMPDKYLTHDGEGASRKADFGGTLSVLPVSDPNSTTTGQRILMYQAALEMARQAPQLYDQPELHRQVLSVFGLKDVQQIVKSPDDIKPMDPVSENMGILTGKPVKAFLWQDHDAHIQSHMMAAQDPLIAQMVGQSPQAQMIMAAAVSHITEHLAMKYRMEIEQMMGVQLPPVGEQLPPDIEVQLSRLVADAAQKLFQKDQAQAAAQAAQMAAQDPVAMQSQEEIKIKQQEVDRKKRADAQKHLLDQQRLALDAEKLRSEERKHGATIGAQAASSLLDLAKHRRDTALKGQELSAKTHTEGAKLGVDIAKHHRERGHEERMPVQPAAPPSGAGPSLSPPGGASPKPETAPQPQPNPPPGGPGGSNPQEGV